MDEKNPQALALAFKRARAKSEKIIELKIVSDMSEKAIEALIVKLAKAKAQAEVMSGDDWKSYVKGQRWYVEDLVAFEKLDAQARMDYEYKAAFPETADEDEMLKALEMAMSA